MFTCKAFYRKIFIEMWRWYKQTFSLSQTQALKLKAYRSFESIKFIPFSLSCAYNWRFSHTLSYFLCKRKKLRVASFEKVLFFASSSSSCLKMAPSSWPTKINSFVNNVYATLCAIIYDPMPGRTHSYVGKRTESFGWWTLGHTLKFLGKMVNGSWKSTYRRRSS